MAKTYTPTGKKPTAAQTRQRAISYSLFLATATHPIHPHLCKIIDTQNYDETFALTPRELGFLDTVVKLDEKIRKLKDQQVSILVHLNEALTGR